MRHNIPQYQAVRHRGLMWYSDFKYRRAERRNVTSWVISAYTAFAFGISATLPVRGTISHQSVPMRVSSVSVSPRAFVFAALPHICTLFFNRVDKLSITAVLSCACRVLTAQMGLPCHYPHGKSAYRTYPRRAPSVPGRIRRVR